MSDDFPGEGRLGARAAGVFRQYVLRDGKPLAIEDEEAAARFDDWLNGFARPNNEDVRLEEAERPRWRAWLGAAAAVAAVATIGSMAWLSRPAEQPEFTRFVSGHGQRSAITLEDGSVVTLAAETKIDVRYTSARREAILRSGQAYFEVKHDAVRPFRVAAGVGSITDLGTAFDVRLSDAEARVTVVEGVVGVGIGANAADHGQGIYRQTLAGQQIRFGVRQQGKTAVVFMDEARTVDTDSAIAWTRGELYFNGEPLEQAIETVNAYAPRRLVLKKSSLRTMPVYGRLEQGDVRGLIRLVNDPAALEIQPD